MNKCKCNFTNSLKESSAAVWLFAICGLLLGIIIGFCLSPVKKGMTVGCNNGNTNVKKDYTGCSLDADDEEEDEE